MNIYLRIIMHNVHLDRTCTTKIRGPDFQMQAKISEFSRVGEIVELNFLRKM